jgi:hypothetical protein
MDAIINSLNITETTRANLEAVSSLSESDRLKVLEALMLGELNVTKEGLGFPAERKTGPRGPTSKVAPRLEACRTQLLSMVNEGLTVSATDLLDVAEKCYVYTDIGVIVDQLLAEGVIVQSNKGRKLFWSKAV